MEVTSCPNLNRESTSFPNFLTLLQYPEHHDDDNTLNKRPKLDLILNKRPKLDPADHTEHSITSPFKDILSPFASFNEIGFSAASSSVGMCRSESEQEDRTLSSMSSVFRSTYSSSVGSNEFSGGGGGARSERPRIVGPCRIPGSEGPRIVGPCRVPGSEGPNPTRLWWDQCKHPDFPDNEFRCAFKMSKSIFKYICTEIWSFGEEMDSTLQLTLSFGPKLRQRELYDLHCRRVALCIWFLATGEPLRLASERFGLDISTCHYFVLEVCFAINSVLASKYINWPDEKKMKRIKNEFELVSGIPSVGGSLYTTHVPISGPVADANFSRGGYFNKRHTERNQKTSYTVTLQGVVDCNGVFTDVHSGCPGSMSDDEILKKSLLSGQANGGLLKDVWIVGNTGYPLMDWLLVPYAQPDLGPQRVFNEKVGEVQRVAKDAFSRLKGRWRCLQEIKEVNLLHVQGVIDACCVLHNICEIKNEAMDPADTNFDLFDDEIVPENRERSAAAMRARIQITDTLCTEIFEMDVVS